MESIQLTLLVMILFVLVFLAMRTTDVNGKVQGFINVLSDYIKTMNNVGMLDDTMKLHLAKIHNMFYTDEAKHYEETNDPKEKKGHIFLSLEYVRTHLGNKDEV